MLLWSKIPPLTTNQSLLYMKALGLACFSAQSAGLFYFAFKMRLIVLCLGHGKAQKDRLGFGEAGPTVGVSNG